MYLHLWSVDILSISAVVLYCRVRKVIVHNLKIMRDMTGSQCNRLKIGTERVTCGDLIVTLTRQLSTRCNLAKSFTDIL